MFINKLYRNISNSFRGFNRIYGSETLIEKYVFFNSSCSELIDMYKNIRFYRSHNVENSEHRYTLNSSGVIIMIKNVLPHRVIKSLHYQHLTTMIKFRKYVTIYGSEIFNNVLSDCSNYDNPMILIKMSKNITVGISPYTLLNYTNDEL